LKKNPDVKVYATISFPENFKNDVTSFGAQLIAIKENFRCKGKFSSGIGEKMGIVVGNYEVKKNKNLLELIIKPSKAWQPFPGKSWVSYYEWMANISLNARNEVRIESKWRNNKIMTSKDFAEKTSK